MRLEDARRIAADVAQALQTPSNAKPYKPLSLLKGHTPNRIEKAFKLQAAEHYLALAQSGDEERLQGMVGVYDGALFAAFTIFVPDDEYHEYARADFASEQATAILQRFHAAHTVPDVETVSSFANYLKSVGAHDPLFWQKVYSHLDLSFDSVKVSEGALPDFNRMLAHPPAQSPTPTSRETALGCLVILVLVGLFVLLAWSGL